MNILSTLFSIQLNPNIVQVFYLQPQHPGQEFLIPWLPSQDGKVFPSKLAVTLAKGHHGKHWQEHLRQLQNTFLKKTIEGLAQSYSM